MITTNPDSCLIKLDNDSIVRSPVVLNVPRSNKDFNIIVKNDTTEKKVRIRSLLSPEILPFDLLYKISSSFKGSIVKDSILRKMYVYNDFSIDVRNKLQNDYYQIAPRKGHFYIRGSIPFLDKLNFNNHGESIDHLDYLGLTGGIDYYWKKHTFLSLNGGLTGKSDGFPTIDKSIDIGKYETERSYSVRLTNNHDFSFWFLDEVDLSVGYGLSVTNFKYEQMFNDTINHNSVALNKSSITTAGFTFNTYMTFLNCLFAGLNYSPSFYTTNNKSFEYSNLIYLDFGIRMALGNYNKAKKMMYKAYKRYKVRAIKYDPFLF